MQPGAPAIYDYEYERHGGVSNLFLSRPWRGGARRGDGATDEGRLLVDEDYPDKRVVLVMDNLNTHVPGSLYEAFEPAEARRIAERLEIHYTPKHGSWLNIPEIEIGVMVRQCLDRRIPDRDFLRNEVKAWQNCRNREAVAVDWRFTTDDARIKLKSLYPSIQRQAPESSVP